MTEPRIYVQIAPPPAGAFPQVKAAAEVQIEIDGEPWRFGPLLIVEGETGLYVTTPRLKVGRQMFRPYDMSRYAWRSVVRAVLDQFEERNRIGGAA